MSHTNPLHASQVEPGVYPRIDPQDYHLINEGLDRGDPDWVVSRSDLLDVWGSPYLWKTGFQSEYGRATHIGSAVDCLALTPEKFGEDFAIMPKTYRAPGKRKDDPTVEKPWNLNSNDCKALYAKAVKDGKTPILAGDYDKVLAMVSGLLTGVINEVGQVGKLVGSSEKQVCVIWDEKIGATPPVRCRAFIDLVPEAPEAGLIDLKTTGAGLDMRSWVSTCRRSALDFQAAMYRRGYNAASGEPPREAFSHLIIDQNPPHLSAMRYLSSDDMTLADRWVDNAISKYTSCLDAGRWPSYADLGVQEVKLYRRPEHIS